MPLSFDQTNISMSPLPVRRKVNKHDLTSKRLQLEDPSHINKINNNNSNQNSMNGTQNNTSHDILNIPPTRNELKRQHSNSSFISNNSLNSVDSTGSGIANNSSFLIEPVVHSKKKLPSSNMNVNVNENSKERQKVVKTKSILGNNFASNLEDRPNIFKQHVLQEDTNLPMSSMSDLNNSVSTQKSLQKYPTHGATLEKNVTLCEKPKTADYTDKEQLNQLLNELNNFGSTSNSSLNSSISQLKTPQQNLIDMKQQTQKPILQEMIQNERNASKSNTMSNLSSNNNNNHNLNNSSQPNQDIYNHDNIMEDVTCMSNEKIDPSTGIAKGTVKSLAKSLEKKLHEKFINRKPMVDNTGLNSTDLINPVNTLSSNLNLNSNINSNINSNSLNSLNNNLNSQTNINNNLSSSNMLTDKNNNNLNKHIANNIHNSIIPIAPVLNRNTFKPSNGSRVLTQNSNNESYNSHSNNYSNSNLFDKEKISSDLMFSPPSNDEDYSDISKEEKMNFITGQSKSISPITHNILNKIVIEKKKEYTLPPKTTLIVRPKENIVVNKTIRKVPFPKKFLPHKSQNLYKISEQFLQNQKQVNNSKINKNTNGTVSHSQTVKHVNTIPQFYFGPSTTSNPNNLQSTCNNNNTFTHNTSLSSSPLNSLNKQLLENSNSNTNLSSNFYQQTVCLKNVQKQVQKLQMFFQTSTSEKNIAHKSDWKMLAKHAKCPFYWKTLLARVASSCTEDEVRLSSLDVHTRTCSPNLTSSIGSQGSQASGNRSFITNSNSSSVTNSTNDPATTNSTGDPANIVPVKGNIFCDIYEKIFTKYPDDASRFVALIATARILRQQNHVANLKNNITRTQSASGVSNSNSSLNKLSIHSRNNSFGSSNAPNFSCKTDSVNTTTSRISNYQGIMTILPTLPKEQEMYINFNDMIPLVQDVVEYHPGLSFLRVTSG